MSPEDAKRLLETASRDPVFKAREQFGFWPWSKQREILWSVRRNGRTAVPAAHGLGKTATAAIAVLDFISEGPCRVVTTAPIWSQVEDLLWREIATAYGRARIPIGGELLKTRLEIAPDWFAVGFSTDEPERFAGHHAPRLLLVVDEASGVGEPIYNASKGFLTASDKARVLLIGNPTRATGTFFRACREGSNYHVIRMSAYDSPNVTGEKVPKHVRDALPTLQWIEEMKEEWGEDSAEFRIRVLGQFAVTIGRPYFDHKQLDGAYELAADPIHVGRIHGEPVQGAQLRFVPSDHANVAIFELPHPDQRYAIFADVAGHGIAVEEEEARPADRRSDASSATVISLDTGRIVAEFHERLGEEEYALELVRLGWLYRQAEIAVENTGGYGALTIGTMLRRYRYRKLFRRESVDKATQRRSSTYGWDTSSTVRPAMLNALRQLLKEHPEAIRSRDLLDEMRTFVWNDRGTKAEAQRGTHDDRVLSAAGAALLRQIRTTSTAPPITATKPRQALSARAAESVIGAPGTAPSTIRGKRRHLTVSKRAQEGAITTLSHRVGAR